MSSDIQGHWYNQHGSRLTLKLEGRVLRGSFRSAAGLPNGKEEVSVVGYAARGLVSLVADFSDHDSLTAWTGHVVISQGEPALELQWLMAVGLPGRDAAEELWRGTWVGADVFRREAVAQRGAQRLQASHPPTPDWP